METLADLAERIRDSVHELERVVERVRIGWERALGSGDDYYLDGVALNLHGFYSGLERIFELVATAVYGKKPEGEKWHQELLTQMASELPGTRPAVLSDVSSNGLDAYRGFRHVVRNVYAYKFDPMKIKTLVENLPMLFRQLKQELLAFAQFLEEAD